MCVGDLVLAPKLAAGQFDSYGEASVDTYFAGRHLRVVYCKQGSKGEKIRRITVSGNDAEWETVNDVATITRSAITSLAATVVHEIRVDLA